MIRREWLETAPLRRARTLPAALYCDADLLALEQRAVFGRSWQLLAPAAALAGAGDHAVDTLGTTPVVLVRGDDGVLRGFHNVCRHRGGPLALADGRGARALHCRYHGWTYALDGALRAAPGMQDAENFDPDRICLPAIRIAEWHGLVFGALHDEVPPFEDVVAGIAARAAPTFAAPLAFARRVRYELDCNWKVYVDNYLEGYHVPHVHPALNRLLDARNYVTETARWHSLQQAALAGSGGPYGAGTAQYFFVYPNTMLNCLPNRLQTNRVTPLGVSRCRVEFDYYYPAGAAAPAEDQAFSDAVQAEDAAICAAVQQGLASGSYDSGRLSPQREAGVMHFHDLLRAAYRAALEGNP